MSGLVIKLIAFVCMVFDHTQIMFPEYTPLWFRLVGRFAFPAFAFLIAEGCRKTSSMEKYIFRLGILAVMTELPYDLAFGHESISYISDMNIIFTLFTGALMIYVLTRIYNKPLKLFLILYILFMGKLVELDYGFYGVILIVGYYYIREKWQIMLFTAVLFFIKWMRYIYPPSFLTAFCIVSCFGWLLPVLYNGKRGREPKYMFYVLYPLHIIILGILRYILL